MLQVGGGRNNNNLERSLKLEYTPFDVVLPIQVGALNGATWIYNLPHIAGLSVFGGYFVAVFGLFSLIIRVKSLLFAGIRGSTLAVFCGLMLASFSHKWLCEYQSFMACDASSQLRSFTSLGIWQSV